MKQFRSVKFRLTLLYAFLLALILSAFSMFMYMELSRTLYADLDRRLADESAQIEDSVQDYVQGLFLTEEKSGISPKGFFDPLSFARKIQPALLEVLSLWKRFGSPVDRSTLLTRIIGLDRSTLATNLKGWENEIIFPDYERDSVFMETGNSFQTIHFQKRPIRLHYHLVRHAARPIFIIQAGLEMDSIHNALRRLAFIMLISIPGAVFCACVAGWLLAKRSFRPVDLMIREARNITSAHLKSRLPRTHTEDELDRLAQTLNEMMDRIEGSMHAIKDFSSDISHELKTPLAIIRGEIELALRRPRTSEEFHVSLRVMLGEVDELIRLVDDLMLLVKSDARQLRLEQKEVLLEEVLAQIVDRFQDRAQKKNITIQSELGVHAPVLGDALYLKRLFMNLIDNALKFTQEGGLIQISLALERGRVVALVQDNGPGIAPEYQEKVFARFYRTDQSRSMEGAGLGLNIAKTICETHGGKLSLASQKGQGTAVTVDLPLLSKLA